MRFRTAADGATPARHNGSMTSRSDHERAAQAAAEADHVYREILRRNPEHEPNPSVDRVRDVCELLGDPQRAYRVVHVTGTNGKTSTSRMIERLVREHGLRTGRFTSRT